MPKSRLAASPHQKKKPTKPRKPYKKRTEKAEEVPVKISKKPSFVASKGAYLTNKELLAELKACNITDIMSDKLARMLQLLCARYGKKGNFANYTYNDDMQGYAMLMLVRTWRSFNPKKSNNPFAFFTQCIKNSFIQYLNQEKRQRVIRDELLVDMGANPSFNYIDSFNDEGDADLGPIPNALPSAEVEDEEDHEKFETDMKTLEKHIKELPEDEFALNKEEQQSDTKEE